MSPMRNKWQDSVDETTNWAPFVGILFILIAVLFFMVWSIKVGSERSQDNFDRMICESAQESGNTHYLGLCDAYYHGAPIESLRGTIQ